MKDKKEIIISSDYTSIAPKREYTSIWNPPTQIVAGPAVTVMTQGAFRFRNDDGNESSAGATWRQNQSIDENINVTAGDVIFRLRIAVAETGGKAINNWTSNIEYRLNGGSWLVIDETTTPVRFTTSTQLTNGNNTTDHGVTGTGTWIGTTNGGQCEAASVGGSAADFGANTYALFELGLVLISASLSNNDTVEFRLAACDNAASADYPLVTITVTNPIINQGAFRFRNDDGDETSGGATWRQNESVDDSIDVTSGNANFRLRIAAAEINGAASNNWTSNIEYRLNGGSWTIIDGSTTPVQFTSATQLTDGSNTTDHGVGGTGSWIGATNGGQCEAAAVGGANTDYAANTYALFELGLVLIKASLSHNDTIEIRLAACGNAGSADYPLVTIIKVVVNQGSFRFRNDDGDETSGGATWKAAQDEDVSHDIERGRGNGTGRIRLRIAVETVGGAADNWTSPIQYRRNGGSWTNITVSELEYPGIAAVTGLVDGSDTTDHGVTAAGTWIGATNGGQCEAADVGGANTDIPADGYVLFEFPLRVYWGNDFSLNGTTYDFRLSACDNAGTADYPRLTVIRGLFDWDDWRWRNDDGDETSGGATFAADAKTAIDIDLGDGTSDVKMRLRGSKTEKNGGTLWGSNAAVQVIIYRINGGSWLTLTTTSNIIKHFDSTHLTNDANTTEHGVTNTGGGTWIVENKGVAESSAIIPVVDHWPAFAYAFGESTILFEAAGLNHNDVVEFKDRHPSDTIQSNGVATVNILKDVDDSFNSFGGL
jgi:hypothetical protein